MWCGLALPQFSQNVNDGADFDTLGAFDEDDIARIHQMAGTGGNFGSSFNPFAALAAGKRFPQGVHPGANAVDGADLI